MSRSVVRAAQALGEAWETQSFSEPDVALASLPVHGRIVVILDYFLRNSTAADWLSDFVQSGAGPVLVTTSCGDEQVAATVFRKGASDYIIKDKAFENVDYLGYAVREGLRRFQLVQSNRMLSERLKRTNRDLAEKNDQLERATESAHAFVEDVAHDLRTPLAVIKEFASIIADEVSGPVTDEQTKHLAYIDTAVDDLAAMVDDFLDSAKLRARMLSVNRKKLAAPLVVEHVRPILQRRATGRGVELLIEADGDIPEVFVDLSKASRVLVNLTANAVKFSPRGGKVKIQVGRDGDGNCRFSVSDEGRGIAEAELCTIFERFRQAEVRQGGRIEGFGLGLAISVQMAAMNFGRLEVKSQVGKGSTFTLVLPPADRDGLARAYADWCVTHYPESPIMCIAFEPTHGTSLETLREFLSDNCFARDLVLEWEGKRVLAMGPSTDAPRWLDRLGQAAAARLEGDLNESVRYRASTPTLHHVPDSMYTLIEWINQGGEVANAVG
ncbi:MAG: ATP-binding protein [Phycisphaerales bacterium]